jgi:phosphomannomutase
MVKAAALAGLQSCGCRIFDLGLSPTPVIQHFVRSRRLAGGISITASHNDSRWNALKFIGRGGLLLDAFQSEEVMDLYHLGEFRKCSWDGLGIVTPVRNAAAGYFRRLLKLLDREAIRKRCFRVVTDACGGSGAGLMGKFLEELGCSVVALNDRPEGEFPHPPEPNVRNMSGLASVVAAVGADIGVLLNSDGDRIGIVDEGGHPLSEECVFPLIAEHVLSSSPGCVVSTLSTSRMVEACASRHGRAVVRTRIGEGYVAQRVLSEKAAIGGEGSGGVIVPRCTHWFDGFACMGMLLECLAQRGETVAGLVEALPRYTMIKGAAVAPSHRIYPIVEFFRRKYRDRNPNLEDGVRVDWPDAWLHIRASNTEPLVRVIAESSDPAHARQLFDEAFDEISGDSAANSQSLA